MIIHSDDHTRESEVVEIPLLLKKGIFSKINLRKTFFHEALEHSASLVNEVERSVKAFKKIKFITGFLFRAIKYISLILTLLTFGLVAFGALTDDKVLMYVPMMVYVILVFLTCYFYFRYKTRAELLLREAKEESDKILLSFLPGFNTYENVLTILCKATSRDFLISFKLLKIPEEHAELSQDAQGFDNSSLAAQRGLSMRFRNIGQVSPFKSMLKPITEIPIHEIRINNVSSPVNEKKTLAYNSLDQEVSGMVSENNREPDANKEENANRSKNFKANSVSKLQSNERLDESSLFKKKKSEQMRVSIGPDEIISVKNSQGLMQAPGRPALHSTKL